MINNTVIREIQEDSLTEDAQILQLQDYLNTKNNVPFPSPTKPDFTFIDLFAGIGGMRMAFQNLNGKCLFSSEINEYSKKTYEINFGDIPLGDIKEINEKDVPDHDILVAGFPCQAFSMAGKRGGFEDTRGTLFFEVARIIKEKLPKAFFLENVKGLISHRNGETLKTILNTLRDDLGYIVPQPQVINARNFGVPQNRERIFIVGFRQDQGIAEADFIYPEPMDYKPCIADIKEKSPVSVRYYLSTKYLECLEKHKLRNKFEGKGFGYEILSEDNVSNAIITGGMGRERNLLIDDRLEDFTPVTNIRGPVNREYIRKMTPREWARLQGFPDTFKIEVSDTQAYKQFGNSVAIPAVQATASKVIEKIIKK